jgi:hypothetical protein
MNLSAERARELLSYDPQTGQLTWKVDRNRCLAGKPAGSLNDAGYLVVMIDGKSYRAHRVIWLVVMGEWPSGYMDHHNLARACNVLTNLRPATRAQNMANRPRLSNNTTGFKGVNYEKHVKKWRARIMVNGRSINLGCFSDPVVAHQAYAAAAAKHFGPFARTQ